MQHSCLQFWVLRTARGCERERACVLRVTRIPAVTRIPDNNKHKTEKNSRGDNRGVVLLFFFEGILQATRCAYS